MSARRQETLDREEINSKWELDTTSATASRDSDFDNTYYASNGHDLYVVQKRERSSSRSLIPATKCEKLTYIRSYMSSSIKTDVLGLPITNFNSLFWNYLQASLLKTLPSCYLYLFLGSYAPEHHLFLSKMLPIMHGLNILWIFMGLMQLYFSSILITGAMDIIVRGILYQEPWNRCDEKNRSFNFTDGITYYLINVSCYTLDQFIPKVSKKSITISGSLFYDPAREEFFQMSHQFFLAKLKEHNDELYTYRIILFIVLWTTSSLLINQIFKKNIWKILHIAQWMVAVFFTCVLIFFCYYAAVDEEINTLHLETSEIDERMDIDFDTIAQSMTSPPILHILTSRSKEEVKLSTDSAMIVVSNSAFYLLRAYILEKLLRYCVLITKTQLHKLTESPYFFIWAIFFWSVYLGRIIIIPFYVLMFLVDYLTFAITYQCLIEVIVCEWQFIKRWQAAFVLCVLAFLLTQRSLLLVAAWLIIFGIHASTCMELLIISFIYPLGRFLEDITFQNGNSPSFIVLLGLRLMFIYFLVRFLHLTTYFSDKLPLPNDWKRGLALTLMLLLLVATFYKLYEITKRSKKDWKLIFVPVRKWGPGDLTLRILRKKYDSSHYIASQAPRELSRYFIQKAEPKSYRLDVIYNDAPSKSLQLGRPLNR